MAVNTINNINELVKEAEKLPEDLIYDLVNYARFLNSGYGKRRVLKKDDQGRYRKAGIWEGQIFMSDDFDAPLEEFKEYM